MMTLVGVTAGWRMIAAPVEANEASKIVTAFIRREGGEPADLSLIEWRGDETRRVLASVEESVSAPL